MPLLDPGRVRGQPDAVSSGNVEVKYCFSIPALPGAIAAVENCAEYTESFCVCPYLP